MEIIIPNNFEPRDYQLPLFKAKDNGYKRMLCVWHRRAGKDKSLINIMVKEAVNKVGTYYYFFPTYNQGKKILWNGIDKNGFKFLSHIPDEIIKRKLGQEMLVELINGSIIQIIGTDNVDSIVGTNPIGCVFSEYSLQDPIAWGYIRPIFLENGGWAIFNYTSRGRNHGYTLLEYAKKNLDKWFVSVLTAKDTKVFTDEQLEDEREQYILEDGDDLRFEQEYMCSFDGAIQGSYYGKILQKIREAEKVSDYPIEDYAVDTWWDLGMNDSMSIWFTQLINSEVRVIDYYENSGEGLSFYADILNQKGYTYGEHFAPHDIEVRELGTGVSRKEKAKDFGINFRVVPKLSVLDGIQAVRSILQKCWFHTNTEISIPGVQHSGFDALMNYHKEYDDKHKVFKNNPAHDWSSHGADAFRTLAVGFGKYRNGRDNGTTVYKPGVSNNKSSIGYSRFR